MYLIEVKDNITQILKSKYLIDNPQFDVLPTQSLKDGDFYTNVALRYAKQVNKNPVDFANELFKNFNLPNYKIEVKTPGFINFFLSDKLLLKNSTSPKNNSLTDKAITVEFTDPNPFKVFHIGHLFPNVIGESLSRIFENAGADVRRVNYQGDVGMHVAKSVWGLIESLKKDKIIIDDIEKKPLSDRTAYLGSSYALGDKFYKENANAQKEIKDINIQIYVAAQEQLVKDQNWNPVVDYKKHLPKNPRYDQKYIYNLYSKGKKWSLEHFEEIYQFLGTNFGESKNYYFESKVGEYGYKVVMQGLEKGVFVKDDNAVIFKGSEFGLHNRVFINSQDLPTYEAKDLGLASAKYQDIPYDKSYIVTANEIDDYFKVVLKAMSLTNPDLAEKTTHLSHGMLKLKSGKMSSRTGTVITGESLIKDVKKALKDKYKDSYNEKVVDQIAVAAIKFMVLKVGIGKDIIFDFDESISFTGFSGPYVQYTYTRCLSVIGKSEILISKPETLRLINDDEREVLRILSRFPVEVQRATNELSPHYICHYLFNLCQTFNSFYAKHKIVGGENEQTRLTITKSVSQVIKNGLDLLGIKAPESM